MANINITIRGLPLQRTTDATAHDPKNGQFTSGSGSSSSGPDHRAAVSAAWSGNKAKFLAVMGISDNTPRSDPKYKDAEAKFRKLREMGESTSRADAMKVLSTRDSVSSAKKAQIAHEAKRRT